MFYIANGYHMGFSAVVFSMSSFHSSSLWPRDNCFASCGQNDFFSVLLLIRYLWWHYNPVLIDRDVLVVLVLHGLPPDGFVFWKTPFPDTIAHVLATNVLGEIGVV